MFGDVDWQNLLGFDTPLLETFLRGSVMYLALFLLLRTALKREAGAVSIGDLLVVVLIADAASNAIADDYTSIPDGLLLVGTIIFWSYALNWLGYHIPSVEWLVHPPPLELVKDGRILRNNMRKELITLEELRTLLREQGVEHVEDVKRACLEGDGQLSVIRKDGDDVRGRQQVAP